MCRVGGWWLVGSHLTASESRSYFSGVDHEGRQACSVLIFVVTQRGVLVLRIAYRWIYTVSVFRTFSSVFLRFSFSLKKYALFHPHFYKSISALSRLLYEDKNFVQKFCVWTIRAIFQNKAVPLNKKFFSKNFFPVCDCLVGADMDT